MIAGLVTIDPWPYKTSPAATARWVNWKENTLILAQNCKGEARELTAETVALTADTVAGITRLTAQDVDSGTVVATFLMPEAEAANLRAKLPGSVTGRTPDITDVGYRAMGMQPPSGYQASGDPATERDNAAEAINGRGYGRTVYVMRTGTVQAAGKIRVRVRRGSGKLVTTLHMDKEAAAQLRDALTAALNS